MVFIIRDNPFRVFRVLSQLAFAQQVFRYLHGVEGGSFAYLVAHAPEGQPVGVGEVLADAPHVHGVFAGEEQRHGVELLRRVIHHHYALGGFEGTARPATVTGRSVSSQMLSEWARKAGTRTQVALTLMSLCMILRVSLYIFISSFV